MPATTAILAFTFCNFKQAVTPPGVGNWPSEISIETQAAAKCDGPRKLPGLSDPCLRSAATSFGSPASPTLFQYRRQGGRGFARLSGSWEISVSLDFSFFLSRKRTRKKYYISGNTEIEVDETTRSTCIYAMTATTAILAFTFCNFKQP